MENDIALIATGYLLTRIGVLAAFGYLVYRVLRTPPARVLIKANRNSKRRHSAGVRAKF